MHNLVTLYIDGRVVFIIILIVVRGYEMIVQV